MKAFRIILGVLFAVTVALWCLSYFSYPLAASQAYSGASTELFTMDGKLVFFDFNNYGAGSVPGRDCTAQLIPPASDMGERLRYEFTRPAPWGSTVGFTAVYDGSDPMYGRVIVLSLPYWFVAAILATLVVAAPALARLIAKQRLRLAAGGESIA